MKVSRRLTQIETQISLIKCISANLRAFICVNLREMYLHFVNLKTRFLTGSLFKKTFLMNKTLLLILLATTATLAQTKPLKIYISVDMEGIGGIGTSEMVNSHGKDYETGRRLMTAEVNAVVKAIFQAGPAEIVVNDSHGDMQNLLHTELDARVEYIQSNIKPLGMVQNLDGSFDGVIFIGYHAKAGTENGYLAHTGSGSVKGLWINGTEVGEGGLNTYYAGSLGVPVILASGDKVKHI